MYVVRSLTFISLFCIAACSAAQTNPEPRDNLDQPVAITNVAVIPMDSERVLENQTLIIAEGRIVEMGPSQSIVVPPDANVVDAAGGYLLPGLSDMHAHVSREEGHREEDYYREGITTVRNMQGVPAHLAFRESVRGGGPIFRTAGQALAGEPYFNSHRIVTNAKEGRTAVREHVEAGYDYIKVYSFLNLETYEAILDEAKALGIPVIGHVSDDVRASRAIELGQSSIEHFYGYFWELESANSALQGRWDGRRLFHAVEIDDSKLGEIAERTTEAGVWNCPTLWRKDNYLTAPVAREAWEDPALRALGHANRMKLVKALFDAGAGLLVGTDDRAEVIHEELALFVEAGLSPFEALQLATVSAAQYLELMNEIGTVEVGKRANLVILAANPLEDIRNTSEIMGVVVNGDWMPRE